MKIVISVEELSSQPQTVIDSMKRSKAPVMIGDGDKPIAVLLSVEEYQRLQRQALANETTQPFAPPPSAPAPEVKPAASPPAVPPPVAELTQPIARPAQPAPAEVVPAAQHSDVAQRTASTIRADRMPPAEPKIVSQRRDTFQPDPTLPPDRNAPLRGVRLTKPLPKPPRPLEERRAGSPLAPLLRNWQTLVLIAGVVLLAVVGFALIVNAIGG